MAAIGTLQTSAIDHSGKKENSERLSKRFSKPAAFLRILFPGLLATLCLPAAISGPDANGVLYVNQAVSGGNGSGDSWVNAIGELGDALDDAKTLNTITTGTVQQIWVAQGTYKPTTFSGPAFDLNTPISNTDPDKAFVLLKDVAIRGGFIGTEAAISERTLPTSSTILSGDIGVLNDDSDNCNHVVISSGDVGSAVLERFMITDGKADGDTSEYVKVNGTGVTRLNGGGIVVESGSPELTRLLVSSNSALDNGAGVYMVFSSTVFSESVIINNFSSGYGGGVHRVFGNPTFTNMKFIGNSARFGGGLFTNKNAAILTNVLFSGNRAIDGGGICNFSGNMTITNATIVGNRANSEGGGIYDQDGFDSVRNSLIVGNSADDPNPLDDDTFHTSAGSPFIFLASVVGVKFFNAAGSESIPTGITPEDLFVARELATSAPTIAGDYHLKPGCFAIDAGDNTYFNPGNIPDLSGITTDLDGNIRIFDTAIDMGAYEFGAPSLVSDWELY